MTDPVGTIISTDDTPTPEEFFFVLHEPVKKEQFIEFDTDEGRAVARVSNVRKTNQYFMQAESVSEYAKNGQNIEDHLPTADWEYLVGEGRILGVYDSGDNNLIKRPSFPPSPGTDVFVAETDRLADFLGVDNSGIHIGDVKFQDLGANLNLTKLYQKHLAILAQSGAGKSYLASVMLEELLDRDPQDGQLATVVIDPHGEYAGFAEDSEYMDRVKVYGDNDISIGVPELNAGSFDHYFGDVSAAQRREMEKILSDFQDEGRGTYDLHDLISAVEQHDMTQSTKNVWLDRLNKMKYMGLFKEYDSPALQNVEPGKMLVLDLSDIVYRQKKQIIAAYVTDKLFKARRKGEIPPFFLLVEEAHNFIPEGTSSSDAPARSVITKIAREGRKFHACLGLISQRPAKLSQTALSQCNTNIILRVTNPYDLDRIKKGSEGITDDVMNSIPGLRTGECIVVGEAVNYPMFVDVRERRSDEFETGKALEDVCKEYADAAEQDDDDIEAFM
jgi:DNA helicase HerA-like ATPase